MVVISPLSQASSSSSSARDNRYDVFLSFRGLDTRLNFTDHLHRALINSNITTFLDDEDIETGEDLKPELENAIKASRASIIVLSKNYASSTWCLDELVIILEQHKNTNHIVIPIFYHVEPTGIRKQESSFGDAMAKHKQRLKAKKNVEEKSQLARKMEIWKKALTEVASLKGMDSKGRQETEFIDEIVKDIYQRLGVLLRTTSTPILYGMEYEIDIITSWLKDGSLHTVDILTVLGLSGIGKTSLARHVHESHRHLFARSSFIEGVNQKCTQQVNGLLDLQKQLSDDISKSSPIQIHDVFKYTSMIENALARQKVFMVLDDIDSLKQLDALLGKKGFHPGSKIIITTKDVSLTEKYVSIHSIVQPKLTKLFLEGLDEEASLQLLSHHAFKGNGPKEGYGEVSKNLIVYCQGHPLALKVLGEALHERDVAEWEECVKGLNEEPDSRIQKALQMSFDSLPQNNDKELFKHIACFFIGKDRNYTETILKACGIRTLQGITNLIEKCLLSIGQWNELKMHQLLQEMGRDVVRQESPNKPWKRSRLWCHEESFNVLEQNKGTGKVKGLILDMEVLEKEKLCGSVELTTDALSKMYNLMVLQLNYVQLSGSYNNFPQQLRLLCMRGSLLKSIPLDMQMENLVDLDMSYSNLEFFDLTYGNLQQTGKKMQHVTGSCSKDKQLLRSLKILNLSFCRQLRNIGGFFEIPALERLILENCISLIEVCESIEHCDELFLIDLSYCHMLKKLPRNVVKLKKVETLLLDGLDLGEFSIDMRDMDLAEICKANSTGINSQASSSAIKETMGRHLESSLFFLPSSLVTLSLKSCKLSDLSFPLDFNCLSQLKNLYLDDNPIVSMPGCVRSLCKLEILSMSKCNFLETVKHPPSTLRRLRLVIFDPLNQLQKLEFVQEMSPLRIQLHMQSYRHLLFGIEGMVNIQPLSHVKEEVLCSLGWNNLDFIKNYQKQKTWHMIGGTQNSQIQMYYQFGIFSTFYVGKEIPNWISDRRKGSSISFTIPTSPNNLKGLNLCYVLDVSNESLPLIIISNKTKNRTWIYDHYVEKVDSTEECLTYLSHWMFGKNEMEDGDQLTISIINNHLVGCIIRECGVSFAYDDEDGKNKMEEEDALGYYKSWNYIIGGDLSTFQTTTGEYILTMKRFILSHSTEVYKFYLPHVADGACFKAVSGAWFRAFSQRKSDVVGDVTEILLDMATELVNAATSDSEMDWTKSIEICELVTRDHRQARDVIKAIKNRLGNKNKDTQLFAVMLLEVLMNNIGEPIHTQVIDMGILPLLVKLVKKKSNSDLPVREKIFYLLDATQTSLGGASGMFPQYYSAYYDLVSAGVQFSQRPEVLPKNYSTSDSSKSDSSNGELATSGNDMSGPPTVPHAVSESSIIQKAGSALEVLTDVLDAIYIQYPEQAKDEFTLDLVEQCSFHKQQVMHLAATSRDEKSISQAIELNDQLHKVLSRHDALVSGRSMFSTTQVDQEEAEEEDPEQLFRRMRKGKACVKPEAENYQTDRRLGLLGLLGSAVPADRLNRLLIRPISLEPKQELITTRPAAAVSIPPPPAEHVEREKFFQENKADGSSFGDHMMGLSLHSRNASSSRGDSLDLSD